MSESKQDDNTKDKEVPENTDDDDTTTAGVTLKQRQNKTTIQDIDPLVSPRRLKAWSTGYYLSKRQMFYPVRYRTFTPLTPVPARTLCPDGVLRYLDVHFQIDWSGLPVVEQDRLQTIIGAGLTVACDGPGLELAKFDTVRFFSELSQPVWICDIKRHHHLFLLCSAVLDGELWDCDVPKTIVHRYGRNGLVVVRSKEEANAIMEEAGAILTAPVESKEPVRYKGYYVSEKYVLYPIEIAVLKYTRLPTEECRLVYANDQCGALVWDAGMVTLHWPGLPDSERVRLHNVIDVRCEVSLHSPEVVQFDDKKYSCVRTHTSMPYMLRKGRYGESLLLLGTAYRYDVDGCLRREWSDVLPLTVEGFPKGDLEVSSS